MQTKKLYPKKTERIWVRKMAHKNSQRYTTQMDSSTKTEKK